jgi:LPXTG-site transpeptidase (sortase) family protein
MTSNEKDKFYKEIFLLPGKKLWKFFILLFLVNFLIINWSDFSWLFNYEFFSRGISGYFEKKQIQIVETVEEQKGSDFVDREDSIEIPKIGVVAPIVSPEGNSEEDFQRALKKGVLYYPQSALPGENGTTIILGHTAPANWPKINYDGIFNDLNELETGDEIFVYFGQRQYIFSVREKFFLNPGQDIPQDLTNSEPMLILLSCWPPGKDQKRIAIATELVN